MPNAAVPAYPFMKYLGIFVFSDRNNITTPSGRASLNSSFVGALGRDNFKNDDGDRLPSCVLANSRSVTGTSYTSRRTVHASATPAAAPTTLFVSHKPRQSRGRVSMPLRISD